MKNILLLLSILFFYYQHSFSQNIETYLLNHSQTIDLANPSFQLFEEDFYENDLFFFGFVHGSASNSTVKCRKIAACRFILKPDLISELRAATLAIVTAT